MYLQCNKLPHYLVSASHPYKCAYDTILFYGDPQPIPVEEIIESYGISLEYQYLRKNGRILGKTIFDDGLEAVSCEGPSGPTHEHR